MVEGGARSCFGRAPHSGIDCLYNFLQNIITSLHILKETILVLIGLESTLHVKYHSILIGLESTNVFFD